MPDLTWIGKDKVKNYAEKVALHVLERRYNFGGASENKIIHGDNLLALKSLLPEYEGRVKCIYIDPPYNTGNENWIYNDNVKSPQIQKWLNQVVGKEGEDLSRHDKWLCMMYPRLKLLKKLLAEDGAIFISIDDNEQANLKLICDEIFNPNNYQATITYVRKTSGKQDSKNFVKSTEFILVYGKSDLWQCNEILAEEQVIARYNKIAEDGRKYRETDLRKTGSGDRREDRPLMYYPFYYNPTTKELTLENKSPAHIQIFPIKPDGTAGRWRWGYDTSLQNLDCLIAKIMPKYKSEKKYTVYELDYIDKRGENLTVKEHTNWDRKEFNSDNAIQDLKNLGFGNQEFTFPKSSDLIRHIIYLATEKNSIILDSFAGSGTTAHAVLKLNAEDGGNRKFILVEMESYADTITAERVKRVIQGYGKVEGTGGSFDFYEVGEPLMIGDDLNENVDVEKIHAYIWYSETHTQYKKPPKLGRFFISAIRKYFLPSKLFVPFFFFQGMY